MQTQVAHVRHKGLIRRVKARSCLLPLARFVQRYDFVQHGIGEFFRPLIVGEVHIDVLTAVDDGLECATDLFRLAAANAVPSIEVEARFGCFLGGRAIAQEAGKEAAQDLHGALMESQFSGCSECRAAQWHGQPVWG